MINFGGWFILKIALLLLFVASTVYVQRRARVRHRFGRQLTDYSTVLAPINALTFLSSRVPATPLPACIGCGGWASSRSHGPTRYYAVKYALVAGVSAWPFAWLAFA